MRLGHASVILPNGNILISGNGVDTTSSNCEIYNTSENRWEYSSSMNTPRSRHNLILLKTGIILAIGSFMERSCELYDPINDKWEFTDSLINSGIDGHTITELKDGRILICGVIETVKNDTVFTRTTISRCTIYDPLTGKWSIAENMNTTRQDHSAILLNDGRVMVMGGLPLTNSCEIYDPEKNRWISAPSMHDERYSFASILLPDGRVFVSGGMTKPTMYNSMSKNCEAYNPISNEWSLVSDMLTWRTTHKLYLYEDKNQILIFGGSFFEIKDTWEYYDFDKLEPGQYGFFPIKEFLTNNSVRLNNGNIALIGEEQFEDSTYLPFTWATNLCFILDVTS